MARLSKRMRAIRERLGEHPVMAPAEAFRTLKELSTVRFPESVEVAVNLGIDPRKSDQNVRGATVLPHGTGKTVRVAVFADGAAAEAAREAGADRVGLEDLVEQVQAGNIDFDVAIATPAAMRVVSRLGQILGPRGLMPNPKVGTVTEDVAEAVRNAKAGQARFRADRGGIVHCAIGKVNFDEGQLVDNLAALIAALERAKPSAAKGVYLKKVTLSTTMGPGITVDLNQLPRH